MSMRILRNVCLSGVVLFSSAVIAERQTDDSRENNWHSFDPNRSPLVERDGVIYPMIKGTSTPDYGAKERMIIRDGKIYEAIPGTTTPDYGTGRYLIQEDDE
ncbi:hypothetical protein [Chromatium okenii]|jgi:hypothetical protein|nr:hypothetical protein [Chromatium okenii]